MRLSALPLPLWLARIIIGARRRVLDLADAAIPGEMALFLDLVSGLQKTKIAGALISSGRLLGRLLRAPRHRSGMCAPRLPAARGRRTLWLPKGIYSVDSISDPEAFVITVELPRWSL